MASTSIVSNGVALM